MDLNFCFNTKFLENKTIPAPLYTSAGFNKCIALAKENNRRFEKVIKKIVRFLNKFKEILKGINTATRKLFPILNFKCFLFFVNQAFLE